MYSEKEKKDICNRFGFVNSKTIKEKNIYSGKEHNYIVNENKYIIFEKNYFKLLISNIDPFKDNDFGITIKKLKNIINNFFSLLRTEMNISQIAFNKVDISCEYVLKNKEYHLKKIEFIGQIDRTFDDKDIGKTPFISYFNPCLLNGKNNLCSEILMYNREKERSLLKLEEDVIKNSKLLMSYNFDFIYKNSDSLKYIDLSKIDSDDFIDGLKIFEMVII